MKRIERNQFQLKVMMEQISVKNVRTSYMVNHILKLMII